MTKFDSNTEKTLNIYIAHPDHPLFKKPDDIEYKYDIVRKILGNKTICLRCHSLLVIKDKECPNCGAKTITYESEVIKKLVHSSIENLRIGIPGDKRLKHHHSMLGQLKTELQYYQEYTKQILFIGYQRGEKDFKSFYPVHIWDLERFFLIGVNLWNYLYSANLGTFIAMGPVDGPNLPIPRKPLKDYFKYTYFLFTGYHQQSNKKVLILSRDNTLNLSNLENIEILNKKLNKKDKSINIRPYNSLNHEFNNAEWYLMYSLDENIIIIPQEKSVLDIRETEELINLMRIDDISRDYTKKYSWRAWDIDEMNTE